MTAQVAAAASRRSRVGGSREHSGPIGIASGDFSTPTVRRRTTTQPRGVPVLESGGHASAGIRSRVSAADPSAGTLTPAPEAAVHRDVTQSGLDPAAATLTPAPERPGAFGAQPLAFAGAPPPPPPRRTAPLRRQRAAQGDLDGEAAALAAEAAAVRALDSGPLTPPPELLASRFPTPPPRIPTPEPQAHVPPRRSPSTMADTPTPPPELGARTGVMPPPLSPRPSRARRWRRTRSRSRRRLQQALLRPSRRWRRSD